MDMSGCFDALSSACWVALGYPSESFVIGDTTYTIIRQIGEGGFSYVYLVRDGTSQELACKKVLAQTGEALLAMQAEIEVMQRLSHPSLLPLLASATVETPLGSAGGAEPAQVVYMVFPAYLEGSLLDATDLSAEYGRNLPPEVVLKVILDVALGLESMHALQLAHRDVKASNVLVAGVKAVLEGDTSAGVSGVLMDFGSTRSAQETVSSRKMALQVQERAAVRDCPASRPDRRRLFSAVPCTAHQEECTAPYRAPELWDVPSHASIDYRAADIWALGCTLYAGMYGMSPFEYCLGQSGGSIALSILNGQVRWPTNTTQFFPPELHELVLWMLKHSPHERPTASSVATRVAELLAQHPWVVTVDIPPPVTGPAAEAGEKILAAADDAPPGA